MRSVLSVVASFLAQESPLRHRRFASARACGAAGDPQGASEGDHLSPRCDLPPRPCAGGRRLGCDRRPGRRADPGRRCPQSPCPARPAPGARCGKVAGLYDRDEHLVRRTTLDEVPTLFWAATLYAFLIWLGGNLIVVGEFGRDQAIGVWALFFLSMVSIRALARYLAGTCRARCNAWCSATPRPPTGSPAGSTRHRA